MATKNFTQFNTASPITTSDYIVGYNAAGTAEIKTQVQSILNLKSDSDSQTLSFNETNNNLTISSGNTVSLSSLPDIAYVHTNFLPISGGTITNSLTASTIFTTGSGNVLIDKGNYRINNDPTIILGANSDQHLRFRAGGDTNEEIRMTILSSGEVGIGTTLAETSAAGNGGLRIKNSLLVATISTSNHGTSEQWNSTYTTFANSSASNIVVQGNARGANISIGTNDGYHLRLKTNSSAKFTVLSSGEVGVGTTLAQTKPGSQLSQVTNSSFTNTTGMAFNGSDWYGGTIPNWLGPTDGTYTVYFNGGNYYRNLGTGTAPGASSARQSLGVLPVRSNIILTFTNPFVPFGSATLSAAIYTSTFAVLASGAFDGLGTYTLSADDVPTNSSILIGFWGTAGITGITVTANNKVPYLTVAGSISSSSLIVSDGYVKLSNLPTDATGLPSGCVYIHPDGYLAVVS